MARTRLRAGCLGAFILVAPSLGMTAGQAQASCVGPTVEVFPPEQAPGKQVRVAGTYFGDNCYDSGEPPSGEGVLGKPLSDLEVTLIQSETNMLVAKGQASGDYSFTIDVTVPDTFEPGEVEVEVAQKATDQAQAEPTILVVTDAAPADIPARGATEPVATFAPRAGEEDPIPAATSSDAEGLIWSTSRLVLVGILGGVTLFTVGFWLGRQREVPPA